MQDLFLTVKPVRAFRRKGFADSIIIELEGGECRGFIVSEPFSGPLFVSEYSTGKYSGMPEGRSFFILSDYSPKNSDNIIQASLLVIG